MVLGFYRDGEALEGLDLGRDVISVMSLIWLLGGRGAKMGAGRPSQR